MKKILLMAIACVVYFNNYAQLSKGRQMIGGSFNFNHNSSSNKDTTFNRPERTSENSSFTGSVRYGYFITDNIVVGITGSYNQGAGNNQLNYLNQSSPQLYNTDILSNSYSGGVFSRYYKMIGKSKFALFGNLNVTYGTGNSKNTTVSNSNGVQSTSEFKQKSTSFGASFSPGITYFVTNKIGLETYFGNLGFTTQKYEYSQNGKGMQESSNSNFNSSLNLSFSNIFIGVNFYFGGQPAKQVTGN